MYLVELGMLVGERVVYEFILYIDLIVLGHFMIQEVKLSFTLRIIQMKVI
jgi:hypothetical protein